MTVPRTALADVVADVADVVDVVDVVDVAEDVAVVRVVEVVVVDVDVVVDSRVRVADTRPLPCPHAASATTAPSKTSAVVEKRAGDLRNVL
ncbi:MAG: hypothetical protein QOI47_1484 [Actinomycetota bacterium]|nr:hypothetical protein [Actinomycetota bacterium]